ncbi:MAG: hypothetical protein KJ970_04120 [Candidatus Eisenbacteria bacterium]|uniref:Uncharacterized protein n=1 Tax=Eiseniibacteriota bacterium TaxID=2212470 RepID=A0A948RSJ6_UNCEI|nr:hypothetical protein [Candidatus Eisenbacteria bacterium]MBU1950424.1 hypothetical protein [Candidatus Eisenbacteria bacterium]MBU2690090.1 hypothetical protein [Candidatus Eisenbacteria bacterium]
MPFHDTPISKVMAESPFELKYYKLFFGGVNGVWRGSDGTTNYGVGIRFLYRLQSHYSPINDGSPALGGPDGGHVKRDRIVAQPVIIGALILLVMAACSEDPSGPSHKMSVTFNTDTLMIERLQVGNDTTLTIPVHFSGASTVGSLRFLVTDPHFRVEPEVWESPDPLPEALAVGLVTTVADSYATQIQVVASNEMIGAITIAAVAWSPWASLRVTPGLIDFGRVFPEIESLRSVRCENSSLAATACTLSVIQPIQELEPIPGIVILPPGRSEELRLQLTCDTEGFRVGDLEIVSNDPFQPRIRVEVKAECRGIPRLEGWPDSLDFNTTALHIGKPRAFTLYNYGNGWLELEAVSVPEEIALSHAAATIEIGDSLRLDVMWMPVEPGRLAAVMEWRTNEESPEHSTVLTGQTVHGILPGEGLGGLRLDMTPDDVHREFGLHDYETKEPFCLIGWHFDSMQDVAFFPAMRPECDIVDPDAEAFEIGGDGAFAGRTEAGTGIGSTFQEVQYEFGLPDTMHNEGPNRWVGYPVRGILFLFEDNRVTAIDVFRPEDWKRKKRFNPFG